MVQGAQVLIDEVFLHQVGNKMNEEGIRLSSLPIDRDEEIDEALRAYFFNSFKSDELHHFEHESDLNMNEIYAYASEIFDDLDKLHEASKNMAKHLYQCCEHPNIKPGELYVAFLKDCFVDGRTVDAIGIFKSETKDTFLKLTNKGSDYAVQTAQGVNVEKLDKGCLIFDTDKEDGYLVAVVDNTNKGLEARYWTEEFLNLKPRRDYYYSTQNVMSACKDFISDALPDKFEVEKADQIDLLNRSIDYFKKNDTFDQKEFAGEVFQDENVIESFEEFNQNFTQANNLDWQDGFQISDQAVKRKSRIFKSVLKLDKNFHVYIHGNRDWIEKGVDDEGRKFYKIYYEQET